ncbi:cobyric acid synthase [Pseudaestuariivita rosea]|uniref:cobyric acid synthase n=1 Tax=Pseudaestuariivita rosea TaxID=2763263 RepID=UPI001ABB2093|nr:cobyric acid synthase [Pseudaestuariivita rosea]
MTRAIMIQGAGSNVGKSLIVAGLARAFVNRGLRLAPFKPQNMSNNAAVTADGGEIGRAQALQALAARIEPTVDMNPVLLKPESETGAQVIVQGKWVGNLGARGYTETKTALMPRVLESFDRLKGTADLILVEGAGSPAEVNLRAGDIANMGFALAADVPVVLVGDIDRGGVIAQLVGTYQVLDQTDRHQIKAFCINKFRGDVSLFADGMTAIEAQTGWSSLGVLPWFPDAARLPAEDALDIVGSGTGPVKIAVPRLSRIANFDDLDPIAAEPDVQLQFIEPGHPLPGDAKLIILPGTKSTLAELKFFRDQGWDIDLRAHVRRGGHVLGLCGGYQMLGRMVADPHGLEGTAGHTPGLGLLSVETTMQPDKAVRQVQGKEIATDHAVSGYEIHIGQTTGADCGRPWLMIDGQRAGAMSEDGRIKGCYVHGIFQSDTFRTAFLKTVGGSGRQTSYGAKVETVLDTLAAHLEQHLDLDMLESLAAEV